MVMANTIQVDTMYQLLIQKGYFIEAEFLAKMKEVQADYQKVGRQYVITDLIPRQFHRL